MGRKSDLEVKPVVNEPFVGSTKIVEEFPSRCSAISHNVGRRGSRGRMGRDCSQLGTLLCQSVHKSWAGGGLLCTGTYVRMHIFLHSCAQLATRTYAHVEGEIVFDQIGSLSIWSEFWAISYTYVGYSPHSQVSPVW